MIKPTTDTANDAIRTSLKQSQQQLDEAKRDAPTPEAKHQLSQVERLTVCLQDAGIDTDAVRDCQAKYQPYPIRLRERIPRFYRLIDP